MPGSEFGPLIELVRGRRIVALTGAGCSTESGIPDYRGEGKPPRERAPIQHREFLTDPDVRRRYWARSVLGWPRFASARPNGAHHAIARLEQLGVVVAVITQNVDGLHHAAGSSAVIELHGALSRVRCLGCEAITSREHLQARLSAVNVGWFECIDRDLGDVASRPDGDAELADEHVRAFSVVGCETCGGELMPDVVMFGGNVSRTTLDAAWATFDRAEVLLVVGSSLAVFSGYRFVRRAAERAIPVAIINRGPTRGDEHAALRLDASAGIALPALVEALA